MGGVGSMAVINVLLTGTLAGGMERFEHDALGIEFDRLTETVPDRLFEGRIWAFVDWVLPELSGLELCRRLRSDPRTEHAHITMVIEDDDPEVCRRALRAGADDYMTGPIDRRRVLDRILALQIGNHAEGPPRALVLGDLALDPAALQLRHRGKPVPLMPNELRLVRFFMEHPGRIFSREQIIRGLGKQEAPIDERTVDVWVGRLRRALRAAGAGNPLRTVRLMGYVFDLP